MPRRLLRLRRMTFVGSSSCNAPGKSSRELVYKKQLFEGLLISASLN